MSLIYLGGLLYTTNNYGSSKVHLSICLLCSNHANQTSFIECLTLNLSLSANRPCI